MTNTIPVERVVRGSWLYDEPSARWARVLSVDVSDTGVGLMLARQLAARLYPRGTMVTVREDPPEAPSGLRAALTARCTCVDRDPALAPLVGHDPDCSLQNTGWLS